MKDFLNIQLVTTLNIAELQPYMTLRRPEDHIKQGIFVAEGEKVVRRLIATDIKIVSMLMTPEWLEQMFTSEHLTSIAKNPSSITSLIYHPTIPQCTIFIAEKKLLETIVGYNLHQGIMAIAKVPEEHPLEKIIEYIKQPHLLVALDGLVNSENVGVVVRNCVAFGVDAIIVGETSSSPYLRRAVRNSMGAVFQLEVIHSRNLVETLKILYQKYNTNIVAAHPHGGSSISSCNFNGSICIVFGNEGDGISKKILDVCTTRIAIPMMNTTDSLNVASASAVFLFEAKKQREEK